MRSGTWQLDCMVIHFLYCVFFLEHAGLRIISLIEEEKTKLRYNSHPHNKLKLGASYKRNTRPKATLTSR
jgi:hypothetical protein